MNVSNNNASYNLTSLAIYTDASTYNLELQVNYHGSPYKLQKTERGDWVDLYCAEETVLHKGERVYISQGVSMKLPEGYEAIIVARSSTFKRWGILQTNAIGE